VRGDIVDKESTLNDAVAALKGKLKTARPAGRRPSSQKELTKIQGQLTDVQQQVVGTLQQAVQILQSRVATQFGRVQTSLLTQLGAKFFQNGLKTPLEQQLDDMQAADAKQGLQDSYDQATKQLRDRQARVDVTQAELDADTEGDRASAARPRRERPRDPRRRRACQADAEYARKSQELQDKLADLADAFQNGTATMDDLTRSPAPTG
jgi:hypothetical protein